MQRTKPVDVVVVGAGIMGLVTATELARSGASVAVFEKDEPGFEASGRNMGAIGVLGKHAADLAAASVALWQELVEGRPEAYGYHAGGRLYLAESPADLELLRGMVRQAADHGVAVDLLSERDVRSSFPFVAGSVRGAAYSASDALVEPKRVMATLQQAAVERGVQIFAPQLVAAITTRSGRAAGVVLRSGRHVEADAVVVAAGVWSYRLLRAVGVRIPYQLVELFHGVTDPQPPLPKLFVRGPRFGMRQLDSGAVRFTGGYRNPGVRHSLALHDLRDLRVWSRRLWKQRRNVRMRVDWRQLRHELSRAPAPVGFNPRVPQRYIRNVLRHVQETVPALKPATLAHSYGGVVDLTPDSLPVLGRARDDLPGLYVAVGFNGQGFGLGPVVGRLLAGAVCGRDGAPDLKTYRASRFAEGPVPMSEHLI